jgi:AcrR family transcriptional regulator
LRPDALELLKLSRLNGNTMKSVGDESRDAILDAAERVFATHGFEGASMRLIAREAGVAQALLHYHFKTKDGLFETIFARRATVINAFREGRLEKLFAGTPKPSLEDIIDVMFVPAPASIGTTQQGSTFFAPIVSAIAIGEDPRAKSLVIKHYDPIARKFIAAFRKVVPGLSQKDAVWAYLFALGARSQTNMQNGRAVRLGGKSGKIGSEEIRFAYVQFIAAGILSIAGAGSVPRSRAKKARTTRAVK